MFDVARERGESLVIAHMGNHVSKDSKTGEAAPPNSIEALHRSETDGATDVMEVDVRRLRDGTIVAHHDERIGSGKLKGELLRDLTLKDLREHAEYDDVPTLEEFARAAGPLKLGIVADIKELGDERRIVDTLLKHVPKERLSAFSFEPSVARSLDEAYPDIPIGYLPRQHDSENALERLRTGLVGSPMQQIDRLGFTPDYIEVSGDHVNRQVFEHAERNDIPIMVGGTSPELKSQLLDDPRVMGLMVDDPVEVPELEVRTRRAADGDLLPDGPRYVSFHDVPWIPDAAKPVIDRAIDGGFAVAASETGFAIRRGVLRTRDAAEGAVQTSKALLSDAALDLAKLGARILPNGDE